MKKRYILAGILAISVVHNAFNQSTETKTAKPLSAYEQCKVDANGGSTVHCSQLHEDFEAAVADNCKTELMAELRSPSSYKQVAVDHLPWGEQHSDTITYEAVNAFNAPIRSQKVCRYNFS